MAQAMVQRSCAKLRSAIQDKALKLSSVVVNDLQGMAKTLEVIEAWLVEAERRSLPHWLALVKENTGYYDVSKKLVDEFEAATRTPTTTMAAAQDWLKRVRKACYDISDMVDGLQSTPGVKMTRTMLPSLALKKNRMANKAKDIREELGKIIVYMPLPNAIAVQQTITPEAKEQTITPEAEEDDATIVGRDNCVKMIMAMLSSSSTTDTIIIIPIVGLHGIGKTTLARMVFKHAHFQEYNSRVWVHVSPEFDLCEIAHSIIYQVLGIGRGEGGGDPICHNNNGGRTKEDITKCLHGLFAGRKVLIVIDDIWEQDPVQLRNLKQILTSAASNGKAVVIATTAFGSVARELCTGVPFSYYPPLLSDDIYWTNIKQESRFPLATPWSWSNRPDQEITSSCGGLPALAREAGHALRSPFAAGWRQLAACRTTPESCGNRILFMMRCYMAMPQSMRLCFAYCAVMFLPVGHSIAKDDMVGQWIALDLVQPSGECSATQVAEEYIKRLSEMSFLQATTLASTPTSMKHDKGVALFTMPDLAHDLARYLMFDELIVLNGTSWQKEEYSRYAVLTKIGVKPLSVLSSQLRALRCTDRSKMEIRDDSFSFARCLRVLELKESPMKKLPDSICELRHLGYLNLSGCPGLLMLPESLGHLVNLLHINLSGCSALANLPESFGDLTKLLHVDLSRCRGLKNLPGSFRNLTSLLHLDLSFWSCFETIQTTLGGLTSLRHLNLSHPCCYLAQHRSHLQGMKDVMGKLTKLRYLNLSMFLNPIFYYHSEDENHEYIQSCISSLGSLEHLDLSHNTFLSYLPGSPGKLSNLHTLDLSGCIRLKKIYGWMGEIESLKLSKCGGVESCVFAVHSDDSSSSSSSLVQLEHVNCQELEIRCLEKVKSMDEARMIMMAKKWKVERLKLCWTMGSQGQGSVDGNALLEGLQPPESLKCLELHGYNGETCFSSWWRKSACHLLHLVEVTMEDFPRCSIIPPLCLLPNLQKLILRRMASLRRIDLSDGNRTAFSRPTEFTIDDMENLEELIMLPAADELVIQKCPELSFGPLPPRARMLLISGCNQVMASWHSKGTDHPTTSEPVVTRLVVESCHLPLSEWSLIHHLPGLHSLTIKSCPHLTTCSPEIIRALSSLKTLCFSQCDELPDDIGELGSLRELQLTDCTRMRELPESLGHLTSLKKLAIERCPAIVNMPEKLINLKDLHILGCPSLEQWCDLMRTRGVDHAIVPRLGCDQK